MPHGEDVRVHEYYKSWAGKCEGCRLTPLSVNLPDPRISAGSRVQTINTQGASHTPLRMNDSIVPCVLVGKDKGRGRG